MANSWDAGNQAKWIATNLAPTLKRSGNAHIKMHIFDDSRSFMWDYLKNMTARRADVMKYADFINVHGYFDKSASPNILNFVSFKYGKQILYTETSFAVWPEDKPIKLGSWSRAEEIVTALMENLNHNVAAYIDWNLMLDTNGGPTYTNASIEACILANTSYTAFYKQPLFYAAAHFAKFIPPKSLRIDAIFLGLRKSHVQTVAYLRPDNKVSIILYNNSTDSVNLTLFDVSRGRANLSLKPKSLNTVVYSNKKSLFW